MENRPTLSELEEHLQDIQNWTGLGSKLDIADEDLSEISRKFSEVRDCKREMLSVWLKQNFMNASRNAIVQALHGIDEHVVANKYSDHIRAIPTRNEGLKIGPQPLRERKFTYAKAQQETDVHTASRSAFVSIANNPQITVNATAGHKDNRKSNKQSRTFYFIILILLLCGIVASLLFYWVMNNSEAENAGKVRISGKTPIDIDNPETIIATKLIEITDFFQLAACLEIKNSKAAVEQFTKNHRGRLEHIRIEVIDTWLKNAEQRFWEELVLILQTCLANRRLAKSISDEYIGDDNE